jgi:hypothetical protein
MSRPDEVTSVRQAAAVCNVTPPIIRRSLSLGLITEPPWTLQQLHQVRDETDPQGRRRGPQVAHGTLTRWLEGCDCDECHEAPERRFEGPQTSQGTDAVTCRDATAAPRRDLCRPTVPNDSP